MNRLIILTAMVTLLMSTGWTQSGGGDPEPQQGGGQQQVRDRTSLVGLMENLPQDIRLQVQEAVRKAEQARKQMQQAKESGASDEEIEAMITQERNQARQQLQKAIDDMQDMTELSRNRIRKAVEQVQERLEARQQEFQQRTAEYEEALKNRNGGNAAGGQEGQGSK